MLYKVINLIIFIYGTEDIPHPPPSLDFHQVQSSPSSRHALAAYGAHPATGMPNGVRHAFSRSSWATAARRAGSMDNGWTMAMFNMFNTHGIIMNYIHMHMQRDDFPGYIKWPNHRDWSTHTVRWWPSSTEDRQKQPPVCVSHDTIRRIPLNGTFGVQFSFNPVLMICMWSLRIVAKVQVANGATNWKMMRQVLFSLVYPALSAFTSISGTTSLSSVVRYIGVCESCAPQAHICPSFWYLSLLSH